MSPSHPSHPKLDAPRFARFRLVRQLGEGAQGTVHEAIDVERDARVALKTLRRLGPEEMVRLKSEFRAVRDLLHPNLVRLGELIEDGGRWFFTMELVVGVDFLSYVRGRHLHDDTTSWPTHVESGERTRTVREMRTAARVAPQAPIEALEAQPPQFDEDRLRRALAELASALTFLHDAGKVHRDLKPSNVLVDDAGRVVVIDFGVMAEMALREDEEGMMVGTVPYMAPEQVMGTDLSPASDWYSVGVLLFEALTGRRPFEGSSNDVMERKCVLVAPRASDFTRDVPADLESLCARLLAREPDDRPTDDEVRMALGIEGAAPSGAMFVGRQRELDALGEAFAAAKSGASVAVVLEGESGVGKSALARRFVDGARAAEPKLVVLAGRCHEQERVPYNAFDAVIDQLASYVRGRKESTRAQLVPPGMDRLRRLFPALGVIDAGASEAPRPVVDARAEREEGFASLRELVARVGARRPLLVLLEDVQWADADSLALLEALTEGERPPRMLLLATARRREDGGPCAAVGALRGETRRIAVGGLSGDDAGELVHRLIEQGGASGAIDPGAVIESSRGHPMFIEELVRYLKEPRDGRGVTASVALDDALRARVAGLDPEARRVLALVAAAGAPIAQSVLVDAAALPFPALSSRVATLHGAKLVRVRGARPEDPIEPFHDRVREAVYASIDADDRAAMHGALGRALERRGAGPELLFRHYAAARDAPRAARYAELAAEGAARALAFDRAADLLRRALDLGDRDPVRRRGLLASLGARLVDAGRSKEAAETFLEASRTGEVPREERLDLVRRAGEQFLMSGHLGPGLDATREVLRAFDLGFPASRVVAIAGLAWYQLRVGLSPLAWEPRGADAIDPTDAARMDLCWSVGAGLGLVDSVRSSSFLARGALLAIERGDEARIARALGAVAASEAGIGRRRVAERIGAACLRAAASDGSPRSRFYAALPTLTRRFFLDNDWRGTLDEAKSAAALWRACGHVEGWEADVVEQFACWSLDNIGRVRELRARVPAKIRAAARAGNRFIEVNFRTQFVLLPLASDRPDDAAREVKDAIASWPRVDDEFGNQDYLALRNLTLVALYRGDVGAVAASLPEWRRYFGSLLSRVQFLRQDAVWFAGAIALARAKDERDPRARRRLLREARRAVAELEQINLPMGRANALNLRATIAMRAGDEDAARAGLRVALAAADAAGLELNAASLRARLAPLLGGDEGRALAAASSDWMRLEEVAVPSRLIDIALPGW